jgi:hypothetical protein
MFCQGPLPGQCWLHGQDPFFFENWPFVEQVAFLSGWRDAQLDGYCLRPYTAFFATLVTPVVGIVGALLLVNWAAWALCAWATWRLSKKLFGDDQAALLAVVFVSGGMGMVFHIDDYSPHLPAFAGYMRAASRSSGDPGGFT